MKCQHTLCTCEALPGTRYCSDDCQLNQERAERGEEHMHECTCLHADCANIPARLEEEAILPVDGEMGLAPA
jgi:hypothetical protein